MADVKQEVGGGVLGSLSHTRPRPSQQGVRGPNTPPKQFSFTPHFTHTILNSGSERGELPVSQAALDWEVRSLQGAWATSASGAWEQDPQQVASRATRNRRSCSLDLHAATGVSSFWGSFIAGQKSHTMESVTCLKMSRGEHTLFICGFFYSICLIWPCRV